MHKPTFYALVIIQPDGEQVFGGAYTDQRLAEARGKESGKQFEVRPAYLG
jgi:hypothetical protein